MSDAVNAVEIGASWTNLNTETGIAAGVGVIVQNLGNTGGAIDAAGVPNAVVEITTSESVPLQSFVGSYIERNEQYTIVDGSSTVWARFSRRSGQSVGTDVALVKVQNSTGAIVAVGDSSFSSRRDYSTSSVEMSDFESRISQQNERMIALLKRQTFLLELISDIDLGSTEET